MEKILGMPLKIMILKVNLFIEIYNLKYLTMLYRN